MEQTRKLREDAAACDFVAQFLTDRERGVERTLGDYQRRFPEFGDRIAEEHALLQAGAAASKEPVPDIGRDVGPYRLLERLGHGGQGVVFRAEHRELKRIVALKMLHHGVLGLGAAQLARLRREAISVARLDHPAICAVYEVELDGPEPYLAMRHVPGSSVAVELECARRQGGVDTLPPRTREQIDAWLSFFERAAAALHAAHQVGIVHRDVKPHNLMRTPAGEPVLLDFGLARDAESTSAALTGTHELFGTLAYMAPELLAGRQTPSARHDVYSLGATLYEVLTLQQPFAAATPEVMWRSIESGDVTSPRELNPHLPRDVDVVVATALERDPARRYPTASAFAEDLRRLRLREPILARPPSRWRRALRWGRRHPVFSVAFALLVVSLGVVMTLYGEVVRSNADLLRTNRELSALQRAQHALSVSEILPGESLHDAVEALRESPDPQIAALLVQVLDQCRLDRMHLDIGGQFLTKRLAASRDGGWVAAAKVNGEIDVLSVADRSEAVTLPAPKDGRIEALFAGSPEQLLTSGADGTLRAYSLPALRCVREWQPIPAGGDPAPAATTVLAASADGRWVARGDGAGRVDIVDLAAKTEPIRFRAHDENVSVASFDPSGGRLLTLSKDFHEGRAGDFTVAIHDAHSGTRLHRFGPFPGKFAPYDAAWSPDGGRVAVAHDDGAVRVFDANTGLPVEHLQIRLRGAARTVAFDPVRPRLLTGSLEGLVVFDSETGREVQRVADFRDRSVLVMRFRGDGARIAVVANDATCRLYDAESFRLLRTFAYYSRMEDVCWVFGDTRLVTNTGRHVLVWFADGRPWLPELTGHTNRVDRVGFDRAGARVVSASADGTARVFPVGGGAAELVLPHDGPVRSARFSRRGEHVVTACASGPPRLWSLDPLRSQPLGTEVATDAWFCDDDRRIVSIDDAGWVHGFDANGTQLFAHRAHPPVPEWQGLERDETRIECAAWHPTRPWLATGGGARVASVFDCVAEKEVFRSPPWSEAAGPWRRVHCVAFSPDGGSIYVAGQHQVVQGWELSSGRAVWSEQLATTGALAFSADGRQIIASALWSAGLRRFGPDGSGRVHKLWAVASSLRADPSGRLLLCADKSGRLTVFQIEPWRELVSIRAASVPLLDAEFSPDGQTIVTADLDGHIRIWPVDPLPEAVRAIPRGLVFDR